ncbi:MAG TPA: carbohydrate ABC transporter permease [Clostridiales bacterium]|nr:carbohydrate ABC transporter permease [Clostridiales bacterium]
MEQRIKYKRSTGDIFYDTIIYLIIFFAIIITLYPFIHVLSLSVSNFDQVLKGKVYLLPKGFTLDAYKIVVSEKGIWRAYLNTIVYTSISTVFVVTFTFMAAFPLTRKDYIFKKIMTSLFLIPMFISGGLIPSFILIKKLHLYDTMWSVILPGIISTWNIVLVRTYIQGNIHENLLEAARIDGMNDIGILFKIVVPLCKPILAVIALYTIVGHWNAYFNVMIYIPSREKQTLQLYLMRVLLRNSDILSNAQNQLASAHGNESMSMLAGMQLKYALIIFVIAPIIMVYPFLQKYFIQGVMIGALKG